MLNLVVILFILLFKVFFIECYYWIFVIVYVFCVNVYVVNIVVVFVIFLIDMIFFGFDLVGFFVLFMVC